MLSTKLKAAAGNSADATLYVDDVFSTYLYSSTGASQTINNGIDLAGKGGMVWLMNRATVTSSWMQDTQRGATAGLRTVNTSSATTLEVNSFSSTGFNVADNVGVNNVSWTFRKATKFFDVVTYTGTGANRTIAHNLGSDVGFLIVKRTDASGAWKTYHPALTSPAYSLNFGTVDAQASTPTVWNSTAPTSSVFSVGTDAAVNASGGTYVAYLFANNTASDGFIQAGYYVGNNPSDVNVTLGWEPQFILVKLLTTSSSSQGWFILDSMRGLTMSADESLDMYSPGQVLNTNEINPTATGFTVSGSANYLSSPGETYIYMAIRRPNKPPTSGTQVYNAIARTGTGAAATVTGVGFSPDLLLISNTNRTASSYNLDGDRLRGLSQYLTTNGTGAEFVNGTSAITSLNMDGFSTGASSSVNSVAPYINWLFKRAPGFFDVVCYTGTGVYDNTYHNLQAIPELIITKSRNNIRSWSVDRPNNNGYTGVLNSNMAWYSNWGAGQPFADSTVFRKCDDRTGDTYVAYLFATLAGISKVGSYTGNGSTQTINCGFTGGARFVLIKRTDSTGDWYVFDTARGMTTLTDPYLRLNSTAAEVATLGAVTSVTTGFAVNAAIVAAINTNAASYIFLAIA